jgi:hypothetical protein
MAGIRQGCYLVAPKTVAKQSIIEFFKRNHSQYSVNYRIFEDKSKSFAGINRVFISTHTVPANLISEGGDLNHRAIGRFLGYPCPRNLNNPVDEQKKKKWFSLNLRLTNQTKSRTQKSRKIRNSGIDQIFGFVCLADDNIRDTQEKTQELCGKITAHCRPRFPNLLPGLTVYLYTDVLG